MKLKELIRRLKKTYYQTGNVDCVSPQGINFTPVEYSPREDERTKQTQLVFGPVGTKLELAKKISVSKIETDIIEAQSDE